VDATIWVGLASAALGGAAVLGGQGLAQRGARQLEDRRWQRQHEDRRQEERKQQYASLIAVLHAWQEWLDSTRAYLLAPPADEDSDPEVDLSEVRRHRETARQMLAVVELIAPTEVSLLGAVAVAAGAAYNTDFSEYGAAASELDGRARSFRESRANLLEAMREDLQIPTGKGVVLIREDLQALSHLAGQRPRRKWYLLWLRR
jgi:hypothetical protein